MKDDDIVERYERIIRENSLNLEKAKASIIGEIDGLIFEKTKESIPVGEKLKLVRLLRERFGRQANFAKAADNSAFLKLVEQLESYYAQQGKK